MQISSLEEIISDIKLGKFIILADDENRENEGDLVIAGSLCTADHINFMITHARGLVCVPVSNNVALRLNLKPMVENNTSNRGTNFTVSVGAKHGITTGISAPDRAKTINVISSPLSNKDDLSIPGHIFPLIAHSGGVLERNGHTEASIELMKLAGLNEVAVICEIIKEDGTMARRSDLILFAKQYGIKIFTVEKLVEYKKSTPIG